MRGGEPRRFERDGEVVLEADIEFSTGEQKSLRFAYPSAHAHLVSDSADAFLAAALQPAMAAGEPLRIDAPVSAELLAGVAELQGIFAQWLGWQRIDIAVDVTTYDVPRRPGRGEASFFSLGVDTWHTLLRNRETLTHLIYMRGLEWPLSRSTGAEAEVALRAAAIADRYGKVLVTGSTNLRDVFGLDWAARYFGAGLAAVALSLDIEVVRIASDHRFTATYPRGSTPLTDRLFSGRFGTAWAACRPRSAAWSVARSSEADLCSPIAAPPTGSS